MQKMKVSNRLALGFGVTLAFLIIVATLSLVRMSAISDSVDLLVNDRAPKLAAINEIALKSMDNARVVRNIILVKDEKSVASNKATYDKNLAASDALIAQLDQTVRLPEALELLHAMKDARNAFTGYTSEVLTLALADKSDEATKVLYGENYKTQAAYFQAIQKLIDFQTAASKESGDAAVSEYKNGRTLVLALSALAFLVAGAIGYFVSRSLLGQLGGEPGAAAHVARAVAEGDLTAPIHVAPQDGSSLMAQLKVMQDDLVKVVASVRGGAESVATAATEIAQGNQDLSARTERQASALEQTAASMEQLGAQVKNNADNARQANQLAANASGVAVRGGEVVGRVVETMKNINDASKKISDIISVIDGIAFQTNILALNAAVEAARAGEQGRGFAVVASEVRSLAGRSADAAKEIKSLINASVERVEQGTLLVDEAGVTMAEVVGSIRKVSDLVGEISSASDEQSEGVAQVGQAVIQMDQATQQNAALVEEMAAAASRMQSQSTALVGTVSVFNLGTGQAALRLSA